MQNSFLSALGLTWSSSELTASFSTQERKYYCLLASCLGLNTRVCQFGQNWVSKKQVVFLCDIYMYRTKKKNFIKIRAPWATSFLRAKNLGGPLGPKKNCHKMWVYCIQNDRLGHTVSTQQTVNWSEFRSPRYRPRKGWNLTVVCRTKPNRQIPALFGQYLGLLNSD